MLVDHDDGDETGVHHLEQVLVLEQLVGEGQLRRRASRQTEAIVQADEALVVAARLPDDDLFAAQVVDGLELRFVRAGRPGDDDLVHSGHEGLGEVHELSARVGNSDVPDRDVAIALGEPGDQLFTPDRNDDDEDAQVSGRELLVQLLLELLQGLVGEPALLAADEEVVRLAVGNECAHHASFDHRVDVALEGTTQYGKVREARKVARAARHRGHPRGEGARLIRGCFCRGLRGGRVAAGLALAFRLRAGDSECEQQQAALHHEARLPDWPGLQRSARSRSRWRFAGKQARGWHASIGTLQSEDA